MKLKMRSSVLYGRVLAMSLVVALVPAVFPAIDLAVATYFMQTNPPVVAKDWFWVQLLNEYIPTVYRTWAVLCLPAWFLVRRSARHQRWAHAVAFVGLALLLGPGLTVSGLKEITQRARPLYVTEFGGTRQFTPALQIAGQCNDDNCAFVSGHAADGFFLVSLMLLNRQRRAWWVALGVASGVLIGFSRVSVGAHWLSDALWAFPVTMICSWIVWVALRRAYPAYKDNKIDSL